jgi:hypothetical protein
MEMDLIFPRKKMMQVPALAPDTAIPFSLDIVKGIVQPILRGVFLYII